MVTSQNAAPKGALPGGPAGRQPAQAIDRGGRRPAQAAGKDAPPRRQRLKNTIEFALEYYQECLYVISGVTQPVETTHAADATDADCVHCIDSCLQAYRHVDANANLPTLTEWWLSELHAATRASHTL